MSHLEYKGYNKELQEKVFRWSITYMNVTLIALLRQRGSRARAHRLKDPGMNHKSLFYIYTIRYRGKWFIVLP